MANAGEEGSTPLVYRFGKCPGITYNYIYIHFQGLLFGDLGVRIKHRKAYAMFLKETRPVWQSCICDRSARISSFD